MLRIKAKDLGVYEKTRSGWKKSDTSFPEANVAIKLYKASKRFKDLLDEKDPTFLKGWFDEKIQMPKGARIAFLPNGKKLEKAFSLFAPHLKIHDQKSHDHWDVIFQNKGGGFSYVYTLEKRTEHRKRKYKKVDAFEKIHKKLVRNAKSALSDTNDLMAMPMYTLLTTYMRVGNEMYYKAHGHKGLSTLTKKDVKVLNPKVAFNYVGKDGVPIEIVKNFPLHYLKRIKKNLSKKKKEEFVFDKLGKVLHENDFKKSFLAYCGEEFYPHIVRSHYATMRVKNFLKNNKNFAKEDVEKLYKSIAKALGHKKFNKKKGEWQESYQVTVHSYIQPELVEKVEKSTK